MLAITIFTLFEILGDVQTKTVLLVSSVVFDLTAISAMKGSFLEALKNFLGALSVRMYCFYLVFLMKIECSVFFNLKFLALYVLYNVCIL